jgi:hypothetical protein
MLEKLLLASFLTFSLSLFAEIGWSTSSNTSVKTPLAHHPVFVLTQNQQENQTDP